MASSNKQPNTGLNKWLITDKPVMEDFNRDNEIIDALVGHLKHTPYIGQDDVWYIWNTSTGQYQISGVKATGNMGPQGIQGAKGEKGAPGDQGDSGEDGHGFQIKGIFVTEQALKEAHPSGAIGDAFLVGTSTNNVVYIWSQDASAWQNIGNMQGPKGEKGATGPQGPQGIPGPQGVKGDPGEGGAFADTQGNALNALKLDGKSAAEYAKCSKSDEMILTASDWTGAQAPYEQTLFHPDITANSIQEIFPALEATAQQIAMLQGANLQDGAQSAGQFTLKAFGDKPPVDLPVRIIIRRDF